MQRCLSEADPYELEAAMLVLRGRLQSAAESDVQDDRQGILAALPQISQGGVTVAAFRRV